jgi:MinD superfamily P-loop ATPase
MGANTPEFCPELCTGCGDCAVLCPMQGITMVDGRPAFPDDPACVACRDCEVICPPGAISVPIVVEVEEPE